MNTVSETQSRDRAGGPLDNLTADIIDVLHEQTAVLDVLGRAIRHAGEEPTITVTLKELRDRTVRDMERLEAILALRLRTYDYDPTLVGELW